MKSAVQPLASGKPRSKFSIEETLKPKVEEEEKQVVESTEHLPDHHFSQTDLDTEWNRFLREHSDIISLKTLQLLKGEEHKIVVQYPSEYAKGEFQKLEAEFINAFKHKVKNFHITMDYEKSQKQQVKRETKRDIFNRLTEINPLLRELDDLMKFDFFS